ncbi:MAG TPA: pantoate--beta-alanine ligase [Gemmatimonadales bacterium]
MIELDTISAVRAWRDARRDAGESVALVPTMGFLHEGHLRLIDRARERAACVVISVFVNPTQFGPTEDLATYPRDLDRDRAAATTRGADLLFLPSAAEIYPVPAAITLDPGSLADHLCGPRRPGHFAGVLLVVLKLFHIVEPDVAVFGRKDAQQAVILRRMILDLHCRIAIDVAPTVREHDGLALSSRNVRLDPRERAAASAIPRALQAGHEAFAAGTRSAAGVLARVRAVLDAEPGVEVEYVEAVHPDTLAPTGEAEPETLLAVAARVGGTRLIDNVPLGAGLSGDIIVDS